MQPTLDSHQGVIKRLARWLFSWRTLRRCLIALVALITLGVGVITEEIWRGRRAWERYKAAEEALGEKFDLASFTPAQLPADQNFAGTPALARLANSQLANADAGIAAEQARIEGGDGFHGAVPSLGNWRRAEFCDLAAWQSFYSTNTYFVGTTSGAPATAVLLALDKYQPLIAELTTASQRPYSSLPFRREMVSSPGDSLNPFATLKALTKVFTLRALANLEAGHAGDALADIRVSFRLAECLEAQPTLIVHMVRMALVEISLQPVWEGIAKQSWNDGQLQSLQALLSRTPMLARYGWIMRGERAFGNAVLEEYRSGKGESLGEVGIQLGLVERFTGKAPMYHNQIALNQVFKQVVLAAVSDDGKRVFVERTGTNILSTVLSKPNPYNALAWMSAPAVVKSSERFARVQSSLDLAVTACGLERYRLAHQRFPEALDQLASQFINKVPTDVLDGKPLKFRRESDRIVIYSIGWNQTDDGGQIALNRKGNQVFDQGDWVWATPATSGKENR